MADKVLKMHKQYVLLGQIEGKSGKSNFIDQIQNLFADIMSPSMLNIKLSNIGRKFKMVAKVTIIISLFTHLVEL